MPGSTHPRSASSTPLHARTYVYYIRIRARTPPTRRYHAGRFEDVRALDKVANIRAKVDEVTETMQENISIVLANSDTIDKIEGKTEVLNTSAARFSKKSTQLRKAMQWRYYKLMGLLALIIGVVLAYILIPSESLHGGALPPCCCAAVPLCHLCTAPAAVCLSCVCARLCVIDTRSAARAWRVVGCS